MNLLEQIQHLDFPAPLPEKVLSVHQTFDTVKVENIHARVLEAWEESGVIRQMKPGAVVGVGAGSRGIANIPELVRGSVDWLKANGFHPFVFPAMGSHGGATEQGQKTMLAELGVTEETVGCEIRATMEVEPIGEIADSGPILYQGKESMAADHSVLVSRIKPHTDFRSHLESGPSKMCVIGFGKTAWCLHHAWWGRRFFPEVLGSSSPHLRQQHEFHRCTLPSGERL